jgi:hypothetical protein
LSSTEDGRHSPKYIASLALTAAVVLVVGFLLRPRKPQAEPVPPMSPTETQRLVRLAQRRTLDTMTEHFAEIARDLTGRVLQVGVGTGSGVLWTGDLVVTAASGAPAPDSTVVMSPDGHLLTATLSVAGPQLPLALYELPGETSPAGGRIEEAAPPGPAEWLLAVWQREGNLAFCPGNYVDTRQTACDEVAVEEVRTSLSLETEMAGGGLFDLDGALVAVVLPCGEELAALSPPSVSRLIGMGRSLEGQLVSRYGLRVAPLTEVAQTWVGVRQGVLVSEVWTGQPADGGGLRPGDVIVSLGENPVTSLEGLRPLLLPPGLSPGRLTVQRKGRRPVEIDLTPRPVSKTNDDEHGVHLEPVADDFTVGSVLAGSQAAEAGLRPGDRILRVDERTPRDRLELQRALARPGSVFIEIERGRRRLGALLQ